MSVLGRWALAVGARVLLLVCLLGCDGSELRETLAFIADTKEPYAMLADAGHDVAHGPLTLERNDDGYSVHGSIATTDIPAGSKAWLDREVRVTTDTGASCMGRIDRLAHVTRLIPHFGVVQYYEGMESPAGCRPR